MNKHTPTFYRNGKRRVRCPNPLCGKYLARKDKGAVFQYLTQKDGKIYRCYHCGIDFFLPPPEKNVADPHGSGVIGITWGANGSEWTADLTLKDVEVTIPGR